MLKKKLNLKKPATITLCICSLVTYANLGDMIHGQNSYFLNSSNYLKYRADIIELYLHSFTTGEFAQQISQKEAEESLDNMMRDGFGRMILCDNRLAGLIIAYPLIYDNDYPCEIYPYISRDKSLYIAEVMVHKDYRGYGFATKLINETLSSISDLYTDVFIRVWSKNKPALELYKKLGFSYIASMRQQKTSKNGDPFEMEKYYMYKHISET